MDGLKGCRSGFKSARGRTRLACGARHAPHPAARHEGGVQAGAALLAAIRPSLADRAGGARRRRRRLGSSSCLAGRGHTACREAASRRRRQPAARGRVRPADGNKGGGAGKSSGGNIVDVADPRPCANMRCTCLSMQMRGPTVPGNRNGTTLRNGSSHHRVQKKRRTAVAVVAAVSGGHSCASGATI